MSKLNSNSLSRLEYQRLVSAELMREAVVAYRKAKDNIQRINFLLDSNCEAELFENMKALEKHLYCYESGKKLSQAVTDELAIGYIKR